MGMRLLRSYCCWNSVITSEIDLTHCKVIETEGGMMLRFYLLNFQSVLKILLHLSNTTQIYIISEFTRLALE